MNRNLSGGIEMAMVTNLKGRLRNTNLSKTHGLLPLCEAVVNSIHSIEENVDDMSKGVISIEIQRDSQGILQFGTEDKKRGPDAVPQIVGFKVTDNGIGFTDANMRSFETLDSDYKLGKGCRGVGRLLWLKAFDTISINSIFHDKTNQSFKRQFKFNSEGVSEIKNSECESSVPNSTVVHLKNFHVSYRTHSRKTTEAIATYLFEHCLWYFIREDGAPKITITDGDSPIELNDIYKTHMLSHDSPQQITLGSYNFDLTHIKLRDSSSSTNTLAYCASNRLVKTENINDKIPGLFGRLQDGEEEFVYACYISSSYFDERVRQERTDFDFTDEQRELFDSDELKISDVRSAVLTNVRTYLEKYLEQNRSKGKERVEQFVAVTAPRYKPILSRIPPDKLSVNPSISDKELELLLHEHFHEIEKGLLSEGHKILSFRVGEDAEEHEERIKDYLDKVSEVKMSDLAGYVSHRKVIIDMFRNAIKKDSGGQYVKEEIIHELIMPMRKQSEDIFQDDANLWMIDDRLTFHHYLSSDKPLKSVPFTGSESTKKPDILALSIFDNPLLVSETLNPPLASIVVVEIKRPMRDDLGKGEDPIKQVLDYLDQIRNGKVTTRDGRPIPRSSSIPGYCYILCDLNEKMRDLCQKSYDATPTQDGMGYFFYKQYHKAHVQIISFDQLVKMAEERNKAFFDKLGLPSA